MLRRKIISRIALTTIVGLVGTIILILGAMLVYLGLKGFPHLRWEFLVTPSSNVSAGGGIANQLFNSVYLLILTLLISFPLALGAGIYLAEYARDNWLTSTLKMAIEVLSSLPSIVVGLFGYLFLVVDCGLGFSIFSGALALTFFNLPLLTRNMEKSLAEVPQSQRDAGLALGLSKFETVLWISFPMALPGMITGIILGAGRIFGEAAALIYTAGQSAPAVNYAIWNPLAADSFLNPMRPAETLAVHIWKLNTEGIVPDANLISSEAAAVLILIIILFNVSARVLGKVVYRRLTGKGGHFK